MSRIKTIHSETELWKAVIEKFEQHRIIDQTAFYLDKGVDLYYSPDKKTSSINYDYPKMAQMLKNIFTQQNVGKAAIVSLGCGDCEKDKMVLKHLQEIGCDVTFFGIDASMEMLHKAKNTFSNTNFNANLICGSFGAPGFKEDLEKIIGEYDLKVFLFFGGTFCNLHQGYIADTLNRILNIGDYLLLDVAGVETMTTVKQAQLFEKYLRYNEASIEMAFHLAPIKTLGIPEESGRLTLETTTDDATQAIAFNFGFRMHTLTTLNLDSGEMTLSPNEHIKLVHILVYDLQKLAEFLEIRNFMFKERIPGDFHNQLLFQKQ